MNRKNDEEHQMPFEGWTYQPDYFEPPMAFHVGHNSSNLFEPLCIYMPFMKPLIRRSVDGIFRSLSNIIITTTANPLSDVMEIAGEADRLSVVSGKHHLMEITLDDMRQGLSKDFRPEIPVVINW